MQFNSISEMFEMGGYGSYVWGSVLIVVLVLLVITIHSVTAKKRTLKLIQQELERAEKINQAKQQKIKMTEV